MRIITTTSFRTKDLVYCIAIGSITSKKPEIAACSYDGNLYVYSRTGEMKWSIEWSTALTCLTLADVKGSGENALLTGSLDGKVRVFSQQGRPVWQKDVQDPVIHCGSGDIDGDGATEVAVALESKKVVFLDNDGEPIWEQQFGEPIIGIEIDDFNNDGEIEVIVAEANGLIHLFSSAGIERFQLDINQTIGDFTLIRLPSQTVFATSNKSSVITFWNQDGHKLGVFDLPANVGEIKFLTSGPLFDSEIDVVILSTKNDRISILKLQVGAEGNIQRGTAPGLLELNPSDTNYDLLQKTILAILRYKKSISLEQLDREIQKELGRKLDYNLKEILALMLKERVIAGRLSGNEFRKS